MLDTELFCGSQVSNIGKGGMSSMRKSLVSATLFCLASSVMASDWKPIVSGTSGALQYDAASLKRSGNSVTFWEKTSYRTPQSLANGVLYDTMLAHRTIDCANDKVIALSGNFQLNGRIVYAVDVADSTPVDIAPDSVTQADQQALCER